MNHSPVGLTSCEREPIHIPGSVQAHGVLLVLSKKDFRIKQVSENCAQVFGVGPREMLEKNFREFLSDEQAAEISRRIRQERPDGLDPVPLAAPTGSWNMTCYAQETDLILEIEPRLEMGKIAPVYSLAQSMDRLQTSRSLTDFCQVLVEEIRSLTGHDRVMIYRFGEDWHGEVIAEAKREGAHAYLGHHFPASDIPKQARDVFLQTWSRMIPDAGYKPSPLVPVMDPETGRPVDLGKSTLRSVSPIHLQYLKNMSVGASLTITLKHEGKLWGLIACHHEKPLFVDHRIRKSCEVLGQLASSLIGAKEALSDIELKRELQKVYGQLVQHMRREEDVVRGLVSYSPNLLSLTDSDGAAAALYYGDQWTLIGKTPTLEQVERLAAWLSERTKSDEVFQTDSLAALFPEAMEYKDIASGLLAISLPKFPKSYILWFRPEITRTVTWAGDPRKQVEKMPDGSYKIEPRLSFESWKEAVQLRSRPWRKPEIEAALELKSAILELDLHRQFQLEQKARRQTEQALSRLEDSEARLRTIVEVAPQMLFIADAGGNVTFFNDRFYDYCGIPFEKVGGTGWTTGNVHHPDDLARTIERWQHSIKTGEPYQNEYRLRRHDGEFRWHIGRALPIRNAQGEVQQWIGTNTDIHDQRVIEEERRIQAEKIADLMQQSKESAEAANAAKSAFLANMSHEIRTPLGAILGFMDLMKSPGTTGDEISSYISIIARNSEHLLRLVDDILDVSKIEAGKLLFERIQFSLADVLTDFSTLMGFKAKEKGIGFQLSFDSPLPSLVEGDPTRFRQILNNVVSNAIKFTDSGKVDVRVSYQDDIVRVTTEDTGRGISESQMKNLFKPFSQADVSTTRQFGGTGLGLVLSRHLCEAMGGRFWLERSTPGTGSVFIAEVKLKKASLGKVIGSPDKAATPFGATAAADVSVLQGLKILLVEDSPDNQALLKILLSKWGISVEVASTGVEGVAKAVGTETYDVILMDIQMPEMDGYQATREIRARGVRLPIVALTAHALKEERERCLASGFSDFLSKPIQREALRELLLTIKQNPMK